TEVQTHERHVPMVRLAGLRQPSREQLRNLARREHIQSDAMRPPLTAALMVAALACAVCTPPASADDPPVTVPTATTPTPPPDPAPPPSKPKPKQSHPATSHPSAPPSHPVTHASTPVQPTYTPPPATTTHVSHVRAQRAVKHVKVAKNRAVHRPKQTRPAPKPKTTPAPASKNPKVGAALAASATRTEDGDWLRWFLLLAAATGLM